MSSRHRPVALATTAVGAVAFVVLAALLIPWHPVPGGTPSPVPASSVLTPAQVSRAEGWSAWARVWSWSALAVSILVPALRGLSGRGRRLVERLPGRWPVRVLLAVGVVELAVRVATLPMAVAQQQHFLDGGLSTQPWTGFAVDVAETFLLDTVVVAVLVLVLVACARRWQRAWPAVAGGLAGVLVLLGAFVYPVVVEPLFNSFHPLAAGPLRTGVLALAREEGVRIDDVLVADASRRTTTLNAYVSGFGSTRRVVLYDNLVHDVPRDQVLSVVGHELAHAKHEDPLVGALIGVAGALVGVGLLALLAPRLRDPRSVPLILALFAVGSFVALPIENTMSRRVETRADVAALQYTRDPAAFVAVQKQLMVRSLADPTPPALSQFWFGSHPTGLQRIAIARRLRTTG
jgi:STE24 endopeptidase